MRSAIALLALAVASQAAAQVLPGYSYGGTPDGQPFWMQCNPSGYYCYGHRGDPANGGGEPFWSQGPAKREEPRR